LNGRPPDDKPPSNQQAKRGRFDHDQGTGVSPTATQRARRNHTVPHRIPVVVDIGGCASAVDVAMANLKVQIRLYYFIGGGKALVAGASGENALAAGACGMYVRYTLLCSHLHDGYMLLLHVVE